MAPMFRPESIINLPEQLCSFQFKLIFHLSTVVSLPTSIRASSFDVVRCKSDQKSIRIAKALYRLAVERSTL